MTKTLRVIYYKDGNVYDLNGRFKTVTISGDTAQVYRTCSVSLNNTRDGRKYDIPYKNGGELRVHYGDVEIFRGIIFLKDIDTDGSQSLTAYDYNVYLTKNNDTVRFVDKSATQILTILCGKFGIKTGKLANTRHVIPRLIIRGKSLYDIVITALTETQKSTGKRYRLRNTSGELELVEVADQVKRLVLENERNILDASFSESIEDVKTRVKLTGGDEENPITVESSSDKVKDFGIMQHYEHNSDVKTAKKLKPLADTLLAELSKPKQDFNVSSIGDIDVVSAMSVEVDEEMTGIKGKFYVAADTHTFDENNVHTMTLTLSRELEIKQIEYEDDKEAKK